MRNNESTAETLEAPQLSKTANIDATDRTSVIGGSTSISGGISGDEDLVIQGNFEGTLNFPNNYIEITPGGSAKADLIAKEIKVSGTVEGNFHASERVVIKKSGIVRGNISTPRVVLEDGCEFMGNIATEPSP